MLSQLWPTRSQFKSWSLPSKLTFFGTYIGGISLIITLASLLPVNVSNSDIEEPFDSVKKYQLKALLDNGQNPEEIVIEEFQSWVQPSKTRYGNPNSYEVKGETYFVKPTSFGHYEIGFAQWYGEKYDGRRTSSGDIYSSNEFTAAHRHLPLPSYVRVTNLENEKSIVVKVNDRGPFESDSIMDLSLGAAKALGVYPRVKAKVEVVAVPANSGLVNAIVDGLPN